MALPMLAAGLCLDRAPGAPWVQLLPAGPNPVWVDPTSLKDEGDEKTLRLLDTAETPATSDVWIDLSFDCTARRAWIARLTAIKDGRPTETNEIAKADRMPMKLDDAAGQRLWGFVCEGAKL